jgi:TRAP-type transport system periplasmic protein
MAYGSHSNTPGKFIRTTVVDIPFNADKSEPGSTALWRLYKTGLLNEEYADIVPVLLFLYPQVGVHTRSEPKSWETLQGLKLSTTSPITSSVIERLGGTPQSVSIIENYEGVQRGTIDGFLLPWPTFPSFKFGEVTKFHIDTNLGTNAGLVMMARKKFDSYSAEVRRFLEAQFGEAESRRWGKYYDDQQDGGRAMTEKAGGHKIVVPSPELKAKWTEKLKPITDDWLQRTPNGAKILETWVKLRGEAEAGK